MKPIWRNVAERAYNSAFGLDEISTAMMPALARDCQDEIPPSFINGLRDLCEKQESHLFKDNVPEQVEALGRDAGNGLGRRVFENVVHLSKQEELNVFTAVKALERAIAERAAKSNRQIEEHTLRNSSVSRTNNLRTRLEQATAKAPINALARQVLKLDERPARSSPKRHGLDEGPKIK